MGKPKLPQHDLYERMNYLYQAANVTIASNPHSTAVANDCCQQLLAISKRAVLKLDPTIKRALCKKCNALLIPGVTATIRIHSKLGTHLVFTCLQCKSKKRFYCRTGHVLWSERPEAIVATDDQPQTHDDGEKEDSITTVIDDVHSTKETSKNDNIITDIAISFTGKDV